MADILGYLGWCAVIATVLYGTFKLVNAFTPKPLPVKPKASYNHYTLDSDGTLIYTKSIKTRV